MSTVLGFDIGSNSVGSVWIDRKSGQIVTGVSVFPAGVDESDDKRGEPKNAKRRMTRRTRITLARRSDRKRLLRLKLIESGLLPKTEACGVGSCHESPNEKDSCCFKALVEKTDPWDLRRRGLDEPLTPFEFGRVLLHLAQRRGSLGLKISDEIGENEKDGKPGEDGKVKAAISDVKQKLHNRNARTFGEFIAMVRDERVTQIVSEDKRPEKRRKGKREWRNAVRNKAASYEHCADRAMINHEFKMLWDKQKEFAGNTATLLTDELRLALDDPTSDDIWRYKGMLFGQRRQSWDLGTLGRCVLHPEERCVPHADMYASRYLVVETLNNLRIIERGKEPRSLTVEEREKIKKYLSGPLGMEKGRKKKGDTSLPAERPKRTVSVTDLRNLMGTAKDGWGRGSKTSLYRFNIENDAERKINTDWFSREIIHGAVTPETWETMPGGVRNGLNRALLKYDPDHEEDAQKLKTGVMDWASLTETQADKLVSAWKMRPKTDAKRLNMSRRAVRNLLAVMDNPKQLPDTDQTRWPTQIEARRTIANYLDYLDTTTGKPLDNRTRYRYATGAKGATSRDRYYLRKHILSKNGEPVVDWETGEVFSEPPPAPLISNPVVRKAIHEVRRHLVEYMKTFGRKPDEVYVELAREARLGKVDADRQLFRNRLRNRIRNDIIRTYDLESQTTTQQRAAVERVILCVQQGNVCPLCGEGGITTRMAAEGENCEVAHIIPRAGGGHNGLSNIVLSHTKCNRDMGRRTPRQFWSDGAGFERGIAWVEQIFGDVKRPKPSEIKTATGEALWLCYFNRYDDTNKITQFKKDIKDIQEMTPRQEAATKYASRQVMSYLADALYGGKGLPERSSGNDRRRVFATDGLWTSRLRREWGLFFDPHEVRSHGLTNEEEQERKEKDRGDHRHHKIDAVVIAYCTQQVRNDWEKRERQADKEGVNTADQEAMANYRRRHPLDPPKPFKSRETFREAVRIAVFGDDKNPKPVCHRPVKRKLIGALHEETLFGPVLDQEGKFTGNYTGKKSVLDLTPNHLRLPRPETEKEAIVRLTERRRKTGVDRKEARKWAKMVVSSHGYRPTIIDPPPGKSGIVRDIALRKRLIRCLEDGGLNPEKFTATKVKKLYEKGGFCQESGVPIHSFVLLRTMKNPVITSRWATRHESGERYKVYDANSGEGNAAAARAYVGGNNHHIEIRVNDKGKWSGYVVSAFEAANRKLAKLRALREAGIPDGKSLRKLKPAERRKYAQAIRDIEQIHPLVDRRDEDAKGGRFVMSLCEGEILWMREKGNPSGNVGYFVVALIDKKGSGIIHVVPHWDARAATERKNAEGETVANSKREKFSIVPSQFEKLAPPAHKHVVKVRITPLGDTTIMEKD